MSITVTIPENLTSADDLRCVIQTQKHMKLIAAKLELGPVQALAHKEGDTWVLNDPPPDKTLEMLKCQRYYHIFSEQSRRPTKAVDFCPPMRINPTLGTIEIECVTYYTADADL